MSKLVQIYTDGGCHNESGDKHGLGSWAFLSPIDLSNKYVDVYAAKVLDTTNNRTEMLAILHAIKISGISGDDILLDIYSDSGYVVNGYNNPSYLDKWVSNGWKTSNKKPVLNMDLWAQFLQIPYSIKFTLSLIKGHKKDKNHIHAFWNDICDKVCTYMMDNVDDTNIYRIKYDLEKGEVIERELTGINTI